MDHALVLKDFNLIKWVGGNSFRTSHYPYSEEVMNEADAQGIAVIDECPAVSLSNFKIPPASAPVFLQHQHALRELIDRDKNRPSAFMWSIANEPRSDMAESDVYFKMIADMVHSLDSRPITAAVNKPCKDDHLAKHLDVIALNGYPGWYESPGHTEFATESVLGHVEGFHKAHPSTPIMISEYGADTLAGMHTEPTFMFSEDYQVEVLIECHRAFDKLRQKGMFVGEMIWNFADFMTGESELPS